MGRGVGVGVGGEVVGEAPGVGVRASGTTALAATAGVGGPVDAAGGVESRHQRRRDWLAGKARPPPPRGGARMRRKEEATVRAGEKAMTGGRWGAMVR